MLFIHFFKHITIYHGGSCIGYIKHSVMNQSSDSLIGLLGKQKAKKRINDNQKYADKDHISAWPGKFIQESPLFHKYNNIESIQLSRHHYIDEKNNEVFNIETLPFSELNKIKTTADLRINCLLIKGYIDSDKEVIKFLETISKTEISQVGFISMMQVNDFTKDNFVDYRDITKHLNSDFLETKKMADGSRCSCANYLYVAKNGKTIFVYFRYTKEYGYGGRILFFDSTGLKEGY